MRRASLATRSSFLNFPISSLKNGMDHSGPSITPSRVMNSETMIFPIVGPPSVVMIQGRVYLKGKALSCTKTKAALVGCDGAVQQGFVQSSAEAISSDAAD